MSKATSIYFAMLAIFGVGLWLILSFGNVLLRAPTDLSGRWQFWKSVDDKTPAHEMKIEQSGKFMRAELDGKAYTLKMISDLRDPVGALTSGGTVELEGPGQMRVRFHGPVDGHEYAVQLAGPLNGSFIATRPDQPPSHRVASQSPATNPNVTDAR